MTMTPSEHNDDYMTTVDLEYPTTGIEPCIAVPAYDGNATYSAQQEAGAASCFPPPMAYTTATGMQQSTDKQVSSSDKTACCLIGGSIACTGLVVCLCLLLPVIIFLVVFFQMTKTSDAVFNNNSFGTGYDDGFNKINFGDYGGRYLRGDQWENLYGPDY